jgi:hypothetical protein
MHGCPFITAGLLVIRSKAGMADSYLRVSFDEPSIIVTPSRVWRQSGLVAWVDLDETARG